MRRPSLQKTWETDSKRFIRTTWSCRRKRRKCWGKNTRRSMSCAVGSSIGIVRTLMENFATRNTSAFERTATPIDVNSTISTFATSSKINANFKTAGNITSASNMKSAPEKTANASTFLRKKSFNNKTFKSNRKFKRQRRFWKNRRFKINNWFKSKKK